MRTERTASAETLFAPDECSHSSGSAVASVGKEEVRLGYRAMTPPIHPMHSGFCESLPRQHENIGEIFSWLVRYWEKRPF